ncbi:MAG: hypothetical protein AAFW76_00160 [Pseudomonadota bacterium]
MARNMALDWSRSGAAIPIPRRCAPVAAGSTGSLGTTPEREASGSEAANRQGGDPIEVVKQYATLSPGANAEIDAYAALVKSSQDAFLGWCLVSVLSTSDGVVRPDPLFVEPSILPERDYAAALIAHRTAVTFSDIAWQPLDPLIAADGSGEQTCAAYNPGG